MAPFIDEVMRDNPYIYIKSHPMGAERKPQIELHLTTTATNKITTKTRVSRASKQLIKIIQAKGGKIVSFKEQA